MPRVRLYFKGLNGFKFPKNYDDIFSSIFINKINSFIDGWSQFKNFNSYTFSDFVIEHYGQSEDDMLYSIEGIVSVVISSISEEFLRKFVAFLVDGNDIHFKKNIMHLMRFEFIQNPEFNRGEANFISICPIFLKNYPDDGHLFSYIKKLLINDYCRYYDLNVSNVYCEITTHGDLFQKFIDKDTPSSKFNDCFYMVDLNIVGDEKLISFAYDVGLGNETNLGFGMLDLY